MIPDLETPDTLHPAIPYEAQDKSPASESSRQAAFRKLLRYQAPSIITWGVPNAGKRGYKAVARAKKEGLRAGVADEHYADRGFYAALEWKDGDGVLSIAQIEYLNAMHVRGFHVACVRTPEFAWRLFQGWRSASPRQ